MATSRASNSQESAKDLESSLPAHPHQPRNLKFPSRNFGKKTIVSRSFQAGWFDRYKWLHYDERTDAVFCHTCRSAKEKNRLKSSRKDASFISRGFTNWKDAILSFSKHETSECHKEAIDSMLVLPKTTRDIGEMLSAAHASEKKDNRQLLLKILQNLRFLARQSIAIRGDGNEVDSNFIQLFKLRGEDDQRVSSWLQKKTDKYTSPDIQNEMLQIMALQILRKIAECIRNENFYSIMVDECTDSSNKEQLVLCFRWVDENLEDYEDFLGLYQIASLSSDTIVAAIKDTLLRLNLSLSRCRGQCYDGASNMTGRKNGVAKQIQDEEKRAVFCHCYGHSLNLAASDAIKGCKLMSDALNTTFAITQLIKFSPKREGLFQEIKKDVAPDSAGLRVLCPTRWTVRGESLQSIVKNYGVLQEEWDKCLDEMSLIPDVRARIAGVKAQMQKFDHLFGIMLGEKLLKHTDNLSKTLQCKDLSAVEGQEIAKLTVQTLQAIRNDDSFDQFWELLQLTAAEYDIGDPALPRRRKVPQHMEVGRAA